MNDASHPADRCGVFGRWLAFGALEVLQWLKPGTWPVRVARSVTWGLYPNAR